MAIEVLKEVTTEARQKKNIYQKFIEVRKKVPYLVKNGKGHQYSYVTGSQVLGALRDEMDSQGLVLLQHMEGFEVVELNENGKSGQSVKTLVTRLRIKFTWLDADDPSQIIEVPFVIQEPGIDSKAVGKCLTYAERYFLLKSFSIPTDADDPDAFQEKVSAHQEGLRKKEKGKEIVRITELKTKLNALMNKKSVPQEHRRLFFDFACPDHDIDSMQKFEESFDETLTEWSKYLHEQKQRIVEHVLPDGEDGDKFIQYLFICANQHKKSLDDMREAILVDHANFLASFEKWAKGKS